MQVIHIGSSSFGDSSLKASKLYEKENKNPFTVRPIENTERINMKLYKFIDYDSPYVPEFPLIDVSERKH